MREGQAGREVTSHKSGGRGRNFATHCRCAAVAACATFCSQMCLENCAQNCAEEVPAGVTGLSSFQLLEGSCQGHHRYHNTPKTQKVNRNFMFEESHTSNITFVNGKLNHEL